MKGSMKYLIAGVVIAAALVVLIVFNRGVFFPEEKIISKKEVVAEKKVPLPEVEKKKPEIPSEPEEKMIIRKKIRPPVSPPEEKPSPQAVTRPIKKKKRPRYEKLSDEVNVFFDYLDSRDYVKAYEVPGGAKKHFLHLLEKLSATPPVISGETRDIYTLMHNMAHFYRVIGKENISLGKDILSREREIIEPAAEMLYEWVTEEVKRGNRGVKISTKDLYEYASFFLTTLSGKAYLARRDSKTRILVLYYSLLVLDKANKGDLNPHGIDIIPPLNLLMDDIENQRRLDYRGKYLGTLRYMKKRTISNREKGILKY